MNIDDLRKSTITFEANPSDTYHISYVANTLDKDATPSAELPRIFRRASANFLQRNGRFL